jgi:peptidoglycan/LPS O-acetylase OafA/YrhL
VGADDRVEILATMRGLAAAAVAWFHFTNGGGLLSEGWLKASGAYGWLGVEVFFVVSGFVLPYSLWRGGYRVPRDAGTFALKRLIRLEPPYLVTLALTIALLYASAATPSFKGAPPNVSAPQVILHVGYLNGYFGYPSLSPVFWTLAIEFQFYMLIAFAHPLLAGGRHVAALSLAALAVLALALPHDRFVFQYLGLFGLGTAAFRFYAGLDGRLVLFATAVALTGVNAIALSPLTAGIGLASAMTIVFVRVPSWRPLAGLGAISYSLYLLHVPIGGRIVNLGTRFAHSLLAQSVVLAAAVVCSCVAAYALYRIVEAPAQRWSSRFRYGAGDPPLRTGLTTEAA